MGKKSIETLASNDNKYLVLKDYLNILVENENRKMRFALTLYSAGCLGLLIKFFDIKGVAQLSVKEDFKEMIGWAVILGTYATFGWAKGILLSSIHHRDKINECIREMIAIK